MATPEFPFQSVWDVKLFSLGLDLVQKSIKKANIQFKLIISPQFNQI